MLTDFKVRTYDDVSRIANEKRSQCRFNPFPDQGGRSRVAGGVITETGDLRKHVTKSTQAARSKPMISAT
jgi:hypothetical protein